VHFTHTSYAGLKRGTLKSLKTTRLYQEFHEQLLAMIVDSGQKLRMYPTYEIIKKIISTFITRLVEFGVNVLDRM